METLIEAKNISKSIQGRRIINDVSIIIEKKKIVTLIGPNGSGKSTLAKILLGIEDPDGGAVKRARNLRVGYMPQKLHIDEVLPITVERFLKLQSDSKLKTKDLSQLVELAAIGRIMGFPVQKISGGEFQRLMFIMSMLNSPELLILDEPVQGVDITGQAEFYKLIKNVRDTHNMGIFMISHDLHMVMKETDHVICLNHHICCEGTPEKVTSNKKYLELFGRDTAKTMAVYTHHHDHEHDISET
jgi:zinc transport system ATP-binding protein